MKIAIMARTLDESGGGPGIANSNLIDKIIELDRVNEYLVFYKTKKHLGRYINHKNVKEIYLKIPSKLLWDQLVVPYFSWKEDVDLIFSPKFTVPIFTRRPTVVINRGMEYYTFPQFYTWYELMYVRIFMSIYYRKALKVLTLSNVMQDDLHQYLQVPYAKMQTIYSAHGKGFYPRKNKNELESIRRKYNLPENFILSVAKPYQGKKLLPRKNIENIVRSFIAFKNEYPSLKLVFVDNRCRQYIATVFGEKIANDPQLVYPGWIPNGDMPYVYSLAKLLIFPSYSESFGLPLVEAMACGCPIVTSTGGSCPEIVNDAAIVVEPTDTIGLSTAMRNLLTNPELCRKLSEKGLQRASEFSWNKSAEKVIRIFKEIIRD